jgi:hypothetical protein
VNTTTTEHLASPATQRIEVIGLALIICLLIFELLRRRRLLERYAIVWFIAGVCVLVLAVWKGLLTTLSHAVGIYYPPSTLFAVAFLFVLVMLVNFSTTVSRLSDQNHVLARRLALLQGQLDERGANGGGPEGPSREADRRTDAPQATLLDRTASAQMTPGETAELESDRHR